MGKTYNIIVSLLAVKDKAHENHIHHIHIIESHIHIIALIMSFKADIAYIYMHNSLM